MKRNKIIYVVSIICTILLLIAGLSIYFIIANKGDEAVSTNKDHSLSTEEMLEDYDTMWSIIEENYPYMGVAERITGNDFETIKDSYRKKIDGLSTELTFASIIVTCLKEFEGTGHMLMLYGLYENI